MLLCNSALRVGRFTPYIQSDRAPGSLGASTVSAVASNLQGRLDDKSSVQFVGRRGGRSCSPITLTLTLALTLALTEASRHLFLVSNRKYFRKSGTEK